jgi:hypothetical protein
MRLVAADGSPQIIRIDVNRAYMGRLQAHRRSGE